MTPHRPRAGAFVVTAVLLGLGLGWVATRSVLAIPGDAEAPAGASPAAVVEAAAVMADEGDAGTDPDAAADLAATLRGESSDDGAAHLVELCDSAAVELSAREESGRFEFEEGADLSEEELDARLVPPGPFEAGVRPPDDRPTFDRFDRAPSIAEVDDHDLVLVVEHCFESGVLIDHEFDDEEDGEFDEDTTADPDDLDEDTTADPDDLDE